MHFYKGATEVPGMRHYPKVAKIREFFQKDLTLSNPSSAPLRARSLKLSIVDLQLKMNYNVEFGQNLRIYIFSPHLSVQLYISILVDVHKSMLFDMEIDIKIVFFLAEMIAN